MTREIAINTINDLPKEFNLYVLLERLIFIEKIEAGLQQVVEGKTKSHNEIKNIVKKW